MRDIGNRRWATDRLHCSFPQSSVAPQRGPSLSQIGCRVLVPTACGKISGSRDTSEVWGMSLLFARGLSLPVSTSESTETKGSILLGKTEWDAICENEPIESNRIAVAIESLARASSSGLNTIVEWAQLDTSVRPPWLRALSSIAHVSYVVPRRPATH